MEKEKGFSMIAIIVAMLFLSLLGTVLISQFGSGVSTTINEQSAAQGAYVAESGQELALRYFIDNPNFGQNGINPTTTTFPSNVVGNGTFSVSSLYPLTALSGAITNVATSASVYGTTIFPSSGRLRIDAETMTYTGKTANTFTGLTRGTDGTTAAAHSLNAVVYPATVLTSALNATATSVPVSTTSGFLESGVAKIESELIDYVGMTSTSLTGVIRGSYGTVAVTHSSGQTVWPGVQQCQITTTGTVGTLGDIGYSMRTFRETVGWVSSVSALGNIITIAGTGTASYSGDGGQATSATINFPEGMDGNNSGTFLYFADTNNNRVRRIDLTTGIITTIAGNGTACSPVGSTCGDGGAATSAQLNAPQDVALNNAETILYIADSGDHKIRQVNLSTGIITLFAGSTNKCSSGSCGDGSLATNTAVRLNNPGGIDVDSTGIVYIADTTDNRIRRVLTTGYIYHFAGSSTGSPGNTPSGTTSSTLTNARFRLPEDVSVHPSNNNLIYISDTNNGAAVSKVRVANVSANTVRTIAGISSSGYTGDGGPATSAQINHPMTLDVASNGDVYFTDTDNHVIRKVVGGGDGVVTGGVADEIISTIAGDGTTVFDGDNQDPILASLYKPGGIFIDSTGNYYISDANHHRVRKVTPPGSSGATLLKNIDHRENFQ